MKTRFGFVSNSSSSSFVVHRRNLTPTCKEEVDQILLTDEETDLLLAYGFFPAFHIRSTSLELGRKKLAKVPLEKSDDLCYSVLCNQDEVIQFLVENNISFEASCHSGDESVFYCRNTDYVIEVPNHGLRLEGSRLSKDLAKMTDKIIRKIPVSKIKEGNF